MPIEGPNGTAADLVSFRGATLTPIPDLTGCPEIA